MKDNFYDKVAKKFGGYGYGNGRNNTATTANQGVPSCLPRLTFTGPVTVPVADFNVLHCALRLNRNSDPLADIQILIESRGLSIPSRSLETNSNSFFAFWYGEPNGCSIVW